MIIFQSAGIGATGFGLGQGVLDAYLPSSTTFRNNAYIHRLNRTLQAEMRVITAYNSVLTRQAGQAQDDDARLELSVENHQVAGKELIRLIIANRGVPEDRSALSFGLTRRLIHLCARIPSKIFERATIGTLLTLERQLIGSYRKLINEAPLRDVPVLEDLLVRAERHAASLHSR